MTHIRNLLRGAWLAIRYPRMMVVVLAFCAILYDAGAEVAKAENEQQKD